MRPLFFWGLIWLAEEGLAMQVFPFTLSLSKGSF